MYTMLNVQTGFVYKTSQYKDHSTQLIKTLHFLQKQFMLLFPMTNLLSQLTVILWSIGCIENPTTLY